MVVHVHQGWDSTQSNTHAVVEVQDGLHAVCSCGLRVRDR